MFSENICDGVNDFPSDGHLVRVEIPCAFRGFDLKLRLPLVFFFFFGLVFLFIFLGETELVLVFEKEGNLLFDSFVVEGWGGGCHSIFVLSESFHFFLGHKILEQ